MLDLLFAAGQLLCILGLLYGLFLVLAHGDCVDELRQHYDPITGHDWLELRITRHDSASRASPAADPIRAQRSRRSIQIS